MNYPWEVTPKQNSTPSNGGYAWENGLKDNQNADLSNLFNSPTTDNSQYLVTNTNNTIAPIVPTTPLLYKPNQSVLTAKPIAPVSFQSVTPNLQSIENTLNIPKIQNTITSPQQHNFDMNNIAINAPTAYQQTQDKANYEKNNYVANAIGLLSPTLKEQYKNYDWSMQNSVDKVKQQLALTDAQNNAKITNPISKYYNRLIQTAGQVATNGNSATPIDTGSKIGNTLVDIPGSVFGAMENPTGLFTGASKVGKLLENALVRKVGGNVIGDVASNLIGQGGTMAAINSGTTALNGGNLKQIAESGAKGFGQGLVFGGLTKGAEALGKSAFPAFKTTYESKPIDNTFKSLETQLRPQFNGKYSLVNTDYQKAQNDYNSATKAIQDLYGHYKLTPDEITTGAQKLNIPLNDIVSKMDTTQNGMDLNSIAQRGQLARVAGVKDVPKLGNTIKPSNNLIASDLAQGNTNIPLTNNNSTVDANGTPKTTEDVTTLLNNLQMFSDTAKGDSTMGTKENPYKYIHDGNMNFNQDDRPTDQQGIKNNIPLLGDNAKNFSANKGDMLNQFSGYNNVNKLAVNQLTSDIRSGVKDPLNRMAATVYSQAGGDTNLIKDRLAGKDGFMSSLETKISALNNVMSSGTLEPQAKDMVTKALNDYNSQLNDMKSKIPQNIANLDKQFVLPSGEKTGYTYRQMAEKALNLDNNTKNWANEAMTYNKEMGDASLKNGTLDQLEQNHLAQSWQPKPLSEINSKTLNELESQDGKASFNASNSDGNNHNAHKVYSDYMTGILNGETPKTMDIADITQREGIDMAQKNAQSKFLKALVGSDIGVKYNKAIQDYQSIGKIGANDVYLPKNYAKALAPITDPNWLSKVQGSGTFTDVSNFLKTTKLGLSLFHYKNLLTSAIVNGDIKATKDLVVNAPHIMDMLKTPESQAIEKTFVLHDGITSMVQKNLDTNMKLNGSTSTVGKGLDKLSTLPGVNIAAKAIEGNNHYLFDGVQRFIKIQAFATKMADWSAKNPEATPAQLNQAQYSMAREINGTYGGLNWETLGMNKTTIGMLRKVMLAPDWTFSNADMARQALTDKGAGGTAAKQFWIKAVPVSMALLQGMNMVGTGHFGFSGLTSNNSKGHELESEVAPNVYASPLGGTGGDALRLAGDITKNGGLQGSLQFAQGKLNPILSTLLALGQGKDYSGSPINKAGDSPLQKTANEAKFAALNLSPLPFATSPLIKYGIASAQGTNGTPLQNVLGGGLVGTGIGKYSVDKTPSNDPAMINKGNWLNGIIQSLQNNPDAQTINDIKAFKSQGLVNSKATNQQIQNQLKAGQTPTLGTKTQIKAQQNQLNKFSQTPLQQTFNSFSRANQLLYIQQHPDQALQLSPLVKNK